MRAREEGKIVERGPMSSHQGTNMVEQPVKGSQEVVALGSGAWNHFVPRIIMSVLLGEEQPKVHIFCPDGERRGEAGRGSPGFRSHAGQHSNPGSE